MKKLKTLLQMRFCLPQIGARGPGDDWYIYALDAGASNERGFALALTDMEERILGLYSKVRNPHLLDGFSLPAAFGDAYKQALDFRRFGFKNLKGMVGAMPGLKTVEKKGKMYIRPGS